MSEREVVVVYGAYGHTGRFVVRELCARGYSPCLSGRDERKLESLRAAHPGVDARQSTIESPKSLDRALEGAAAVINCAGPFLDTSTPLIEAALRARIHYVDITAEQSVVRAAFDRFSEPARARGVVVLPAMAFYGGLGDLLATMAMGGWAAADEIEIGVALDSWKPTVGTRITGRRNTARRFVVSKGRLELLPDPPPRRTWWFPEPFGAQDVVGLGFSEVITISHHLRVSELHAFMNLPPIQDVRSPDTPPPTPSDESGRSSQVFLMEAVVRKDGQSRRALAHGRDIYAVTAPLVVEATQRVLTGKTRTTGVVAPGETFDVADFLRALSPAHLALEVP
jgi:short subunit dehydrogenase-like uncharacterized protein